MRRGTAYAGGVLVGLLGGLAWAQAPAESEHAMAEVPAVQAPAEASPTAPSRSPGRRRDPFRPFTLDLRPETVAEPVTPLQRYELPQLKVAAVLLDISPPRAMLQDSSGMGFIVTPGTLIGRNRGVVTAIEPRRVVVEERVLDFYGNEQVQRVVLEMAKDDEGERQE